MIGEEVFPAKYTTPIHMSFRDFSGKMVDAGCEYCVMEVSLRLLHRAE